MSTDQELASAEDTWAADKAREAAEARRKRILEAANVRMGIVEGTYSSSNNNDTAEEVGGEMEEASGPSKVSASSTSSKLAAMRRRRFKSKTATAPDATEKPTEKEDKTTTETTTPPLVAAAEPLEMTLQVQSNETDDGKEDISENEGPTEEIIPEGSETKKKYVGVAKMRRRMIKDRQKNQEQEGAMFTTTDTSIADAAAMIKKKKRNVVTALPLIMHAVTVLLLFLAGLEVGLQQGFIDYHGGELLQVHSELAPRNLGGLQRIVAYVASQSGIEPTDDDKLTKKIKPAIAAPEWQAALEEENDEFADLSGDDSKKSSKQSNLDPVFQIDLDKLTEGPGLYFFLTRTAVRMHRINLSLFYYGPRSFFIRLANWLLGLVQSPPILCLTAMFVRQIVGKLLLGAKLPPKVEDETQHKDAMSTIKNFVHTFLLSSFPTAFTLYDIWTHLRADMYVILCGLFVGLAWSHNSRAGSPWGDHGAMTTKPSAPAAETVGRVGTGGISDEL